MITYTYTSSGQKLSQELEENGRRGTTRRYAGPFVFVNNELGWVNTPNGRFVMFENNEATNEIHLHDHLGNTRVVLIKDGRNYNAIQDNTQ